MPQSTLHFHAAGYTITGIRHRTNEDRFLVDMTRKLFIIADGMGGCRAGQRAAHMAVDLLAYHPALFGLAESAHWQTIGDAIRDAFLDVNREICDTARADSRLYGMGTTAVLAMIVGNRLFIASLGDSRAYLLRNGQLHQYTVDHNMAQMLVQLGAISHEDAQQHRWRHMLWKHLGLDGLGEGPDISVLQLEPNDRIVLVTDGITETLTKTDLTTILTTHPDSATAAEALARSAVARGTRDDATDIVLDVD